jgi:hypothetical protein
MRIVPQVLLLIILIISAGCHPRPLLPGGMERSVGGTIAGIVSATGDTVALPGRRVTAVNVVTGAMFETTTSVTGGYTLKVPEGTYRLEVELREQERLSRRPDNTRISNGDLDSARNFEITVAPSGRQPPESD